MAKKIHKSHELSPIHTKDDDCNDNDKDIVSKIILNLKG